VVSSLPLLLGDTGISNHLPGILFASSQRAAIQFNSIQFLEFDWWQQTVRQYRGTSNLFATQHWQ
jgi:hypothetical protein